MANQRTSFTNATGTNYQYAYDNIGQLTVADSSTNVEDRGYSYDPAWNLHYRTNSGGFSTFTVDSKNQVTAALGFSYGYDNNGNLTMSGPSGLQTYTYDDENRLVSVQLYTNWRTEFTYDGLGRLRRRVEYTWGGTSWSVSSSTRYIYDGMRVIQERDDSSNRPLVSYTRGTDLSGSLEGAGGIGGLLARSSAYSSGTGNWSTHLFYHSDANGNITYLVDSSQALAASYRYEPFGKLISSSGAWASANVYRFSSKEIHANSGMYYYLYRFYDPNLQRWINRDPIQDFAFTLLHPAPAHNFSGPNRRSLSNSYEFLNQNPFIFVDPDGAQILRIIPKSETTMAGPALRSCYFLGESQIVGGTVGGSSRMCSYLCTVPRSSDEARGLGKFMPEQTFPKGNCPCSPPPSGSKAHPTQIIPGPPPPSPYE